MENEVNPQISKKERKELKRQERETEVARRKTIRRTIWIVIIIAIVAGLGVGVWALWRVAKTPAPQLGEDHSQSFPSQGQDHIPDGTPHQGYNSNPPTSGPHWVGPVRDGIYDKSQPDEGLVHSLEHGRVWVSYKSSIPQKTKEALKKLLRYQTEVILTVRDANDTDIAVAAWTRLDKFNLNPDGSLDENRIMDFIKRYREKAPEKGIPAMVGKEY